MTGFYTYSRRGPDKERKVIARALIDEFGFPWQSKASSKGRFIGRFVADESAPLGTWEATPWQVAAMLEQGFRGAHLSLGQFILTWNGKPYAQRDQTQDNAPVPTRSLSLALQEAVGYTAPQAVVKGSDVVLAAKTGTTDGGRDAWFAGFMLTREQVGQENTRPRITFVAWAGYPDNRAAGLYGGRVHGPVFGRFLRDERVQGVLRVMLGKFGTTHASR